jgi:DNA-binding XRE family transcriptional regulator
VTAEPSGPVFVRGNEKIDAMLARPEIAAEVEQVRRTDDDMNRLYAMNLAMVRKAAHLTQVEMAKRIGIPQGNVSRLENSDDMLLSTLAAYLQATGATDVAITMSVGGKRVELDFDRLIEAG